MTKFDHDSKSYGDCLIPAMSITDPEDAANYLREYITFLERKLAVHPSTGGETAEQIARANLGYFAGYYNNETRERVERLFNAVHPVFGSALEKHITSEEAFVLGFNRGRNSQ